MDALDVGDENPPSTSNGQPNGPSGITLVLPSLRALKAANAGKKPKPKQASAELEQRPKIPRPVKLKPLKEVLTKLITQIKKKDDYAFFIHPVDPAKVPGYADMIKNPMDLGTMTVKISRGKYRSLEEFTADFRLVMTNAKTFNPPGSIYHTEADRIEAWGLDHISRASAHVIEFETDWNIDIEQDDDGSISQLPVNIDDEVSTPRDLDGSMATGSRAQSMTPAPGQAPTLGTGRRGPRGPYKKHAQTTLLEGLDAEGRMPGAKDGVGTFPAGSDWAELMVALKIKGKRYKTKKERLRFEKEGPPYRADGSLDYAEMEDPFSVLNVLVPDSLSRPQLTPLYPPASTITPPDGTQPHSQIPQHRVHAPIPVTIPPNRPIPVLSTLLNVAAQPTPVASTTIPPTRSPKKRRHWTVVRNAPARSRAKDKDADGVVDDPKTAWKVPQDAGPTDFGTFATFFGELAGSTVGPNASAVVGAAGIGAAEYIYGTEHRLFATIRSTVEHRGVKRKREVETDSTHTHASENEEKEDSQTFWTDERAEEAWDYLRDVVYGGVDGYAYVRSLAEFVSPPAYFDDLRKEMDADGDRDDGCRGTAEEADTKPPTGLLENHDRAHPLGVPLAQYVEDNLVDMVTRGRHSWLRDVFLPTAAVVADPARASPFLWRTSVLPSAARAVMSLKVWSGELLDMAALIRKPEELAKEGVLEGGPDKGGEHAEIERALMWGAEVIEELGRQERKSGPAPDDGGGDGADVAVKEEAMEDARIAGEEEEKEKEEEEEVNPMNVDPDVDPVRVKRETDEDTGEDPLVKRLRMNLLALAKRAPLDRIAKLPAELVPESIRGIVPTA